MTDFHNASNSDRTHPEPQENADDTIDGIYPTNGISSSNNCRTDADGGPENNQHQRTSNASLVYQVNNSKLKSPKQVEAVTASPPIETLNIGNSDRTPSSGPDNNFAMCTTKAAMPVELNNGLSQVPNGNYSATSDSSTIGILQQQQLQTSTYRLGDPNVKQNEEDFQRRHREAIEKFAESLQFELVNQRDSLDIERKKKLEAEHTVMVMQKRYEEMRNALEKKEMENTELKIIYHNERKQMLEVQLGIRGTNNSNNLSTTSDTFTHRYLFDFFKDIHMNGVSWAENERVKLRLKEMLHKQYLTQESAPALDRKNREWTLGTDYNIIGDRPINQISDSRRDGACSLVFRISHNAKHFILKVSSSNLQKLYI